MNEPAREQDTHAEATPADRAYEAGDYRGAQRLAVAQLGSQDPLARTAATEVLQKLRPDRVQWAVLTVCALLLAGIVAVYGPS